MQLGVLLPMRLEILFLYILHNQRVFWHPLASQHKQPHALWDQNRTNIVFSRKRYINSILISYVSILPVAFWHHAVLHFDIVSLPLPNWVAVGS